MKDQKESPLYATVFYDVRKQLDISWNEYIYLDMVHKLSYERWCTKSLDNCGADLGITKRGVSKMKVRLIKKGLLKRNIKGHLKVTSQYTGVAVNKVPLRGNIAGNSVPKSGNSVPSAYELSSTKNNNRIKENKDSYFLKDNRGQPSQAKEALRKMWSKKLLT